MHLHWDLSETESNMAVIESLLLDNAGNIGVLYVSNDGETSAIIYIFRISTVFSSLHRLWYNSTWVSYST